jgi:hypothetical protein
MAGTINCTLSVLKDEGEAPYPINGCLEVLRRGLVTGGEGKEFL